jgi:hypothetical protein
MQQLARIVTLVTSDRNRRIECLETVQAETAQSTGHGRDRDAELARDRRRTQALAPQLFDPSHCVGWQATLRAGVELRS